MKEKILIVEDEYIVAKDIKLILIASGYEVTGIAASVAEARKFIKDKKPDWVLLDIMLSDNLTGIDLAYDLNKQNIPFIYLSANTDHTTLEAVKETQPYGFMVKPFRKRDLLVMLDIAKYRYTFENGTDNKEQFDTAVADSKTLLGIIGKSQKLLEVFNQMHRVAPTNTSVLILGESGTGKEKIAHSIHELSQQKRGPLIIVNCAALPQSLIESELFGHERGAFTGATTAHAGKFEQANNGTIFLDEIGELPLDSQVKLLRVLQEKEVQRLGGKTTLKVNVRVITATNRFLEKEVAEGRFRLDLYYRLNVFPISLPPLRERKEDIESLAYYFLARYASKINKNVSKITEEALNQLKEYNWPGNIRELEHTIERNIFLTRTDQIETFDIQSTVSPAVAKENQGTLLSMEEMERKHIMAALQLCNGKIFGAGGAGELLKIAPATLYYKIKKLGIEQKYS